MKHFNCVVLTIAATASLTVSASTAGAQKLPPVHFIDRPVASSRHEFRAIPSVRHLPNGSVLVNDASNRRLLLLDSALTGTTVVMDSSTGTANSYGAGPAALIAYPGDSSVLLLPRVPSMFLIDPAGRPVRVMSVPRPQDVNSMASSTFGTPGIDAQGRWVYAGQRQPPSRPNLVPGGPPGMMIGPDSGPIVRYNASTHVLDTIALYKVLKLKAKVYPKDGGGSMAMIETNPLEMVDDWAVLSDGSVAIARGQDYHIDFVNRDGTMTRGPKLAYAWEPLSDDAKVKLMDSVRTEVEKPRDPSKPTQTIGSGPPASATSGSAGAAGGAGVTSGVAPADHPPVEYASPSDLPDYRPPFTPNAARPDADGNLWIRTTHRESSAGLVYDVVSREGKVIDRVQLQAGRNVLGFGRGGIVYQIAREDNVSWIEKSIWHAPK